MALCSYITTPIYYVNARPHLGHAYTSIAADVANRFALMRGADAFLLTGTDEHGDKIVRAAKEENISPRTYADKISRLFFELLPQLNIKYSKFIRTTDPEHIAVVELILKKIYVSGDIYFSEYEGLYCYGCERFYQERELLNGKCPDHETEPESIKESNYFFKMSRYQDWLIDHINKNPDFIRPQRYKNEVLGFLREPLEDLCISRPKKRLQWGIALPFDSEYITYVWFDALLNYISALGYPDGELFLKYWPNAQHIVAKDILKPHGIYWPIMLKAAGIPIFKHLNVHGYWNVDHSKMSKTIGNVVDPLKMKEIYGLDAFRFFLMREMAFGLDSNFNEAAMIERINADLANDLGNLFSRVLAMTHKYFRGSVPFVDYKIEEEFNLGLADDAAIAVGGFEKAMVSLEFHKALFNIWEFVSRMNKYVDIMAPWELAKNDSSKKQLEAVIYNLLEGLRVLSGLVYPFMPETAETMQKHLGLKADEDFFTFNMLKAWNFIKPGSKILKSTTLFPRIKPEDIDPERLKKIEGAKEKKMRFLPEISIDLLSQVDLRVGTVLHAEKIAKAKKLLKLEVDIGEKRTIVAGIAESYSTQDLIGKQVIIVANLKPAKLMGILSNGMLLAAVDEDKTAVATLDKPFKSGAKLR